jgi:hypothetical protein
LLQQFGELHSITLLCMLDDMRFLAHVHAFGGSG